MLLYSNFSELLWYEVFVSVTFSETSFFSSPEPFSSCTVSKFAFIPVLWLSCSVWCGTGINVPLSAISSVIPLTFNLNFTSSAFSFRVFRVFQWWGEIQDENKDFSYLQVLQGAVGVYTAHPEATHTHTEVRVYVGEEKVKGTHGSRVLYKQVSCKIF